MLFLQHAAYRVVFATRHPCKMVAEYTILVSVYCSLSHMCSLLLECIKYDVNVMALCKRLDDAAFCCWQPLDVQLHNAQSRTYGLKSQVGIVRGVLPGFVTGIHAELVHRWNLWFPSAGVFAEVFAGRATRMQITFLPIEQYLQANNHRGYS